MAVLQGPRLFALGEVLNYFTLTLLSGVDDFRIVRFFPPPPPQRR